LEVLIQTIPLSRRSAEARVRFYLLIRRFYFLCLLAPLVYAFARQCAFGRAFNRAFERGLRSARDDIATNASRCSINGRDMNGRVNGACTK